MPSGRTVGAFAHNFRLYLRGVLFRNLIFNRRGNQHVALLEKHVTRTHFRSATRIILQRLLLCADPVDHLGHVESVFVVETAADIGKSDDFVTGFLHQVRGHRANVAEALNDDPRRFFFHAELCQRLVPANHHAASRRFAASARAAQFNRLAGYDRRRRLPMMHRVRIHHPGHRLLARAHIRRGNIALRPKPIDQFGGIAPRQTFQLAARHLARIADNSALSSAKRNIHHRTLPRHPRRQRAHFVQRNVRRKSNSALSRSAHRRMKHAVPGENLQVAVVQSHRNVERDFLARIFQIPVYSLLQTQLLRRYLKTRFGVLVDIHLFRGRQLRHAGLSLFIHFTLRRAPMALPVLKFRF